MKLLLDTHTFIWWDSNPAQLSTAALTALRDSANTVLLSSGFAEFEGGLLSE